MESYGPNDKPSLLFVIRESRIPKITKAPSDLPSNNKCMPNVFLKTLNREEPGGRGKHS